MRIKKKSKNRNKVKRGTYEGDKQGDMRNSSTKEKKSTVLHHNEIFPGRIRERKKKEINKYRKVRRRSKPNKKSERE